MDGRELRAMLAAGENSAACDPDVVERVADRIGVNTADLASALIVVGADLTDAHHELEREREYATVDGVRVYGATEDDWRAVRERNDLEGALARAVRETHREQAAALLTGDGSSGDAGRGAPDEGATTATVETDAGDPDAPGADDGVADPAARDAAVPTDAPLVVGVDTAEEVDRIPQSWNGRADD